MKLLVVGLLALNTLTAFAGEVVCSSIHTDGRSKEADKATQTFLKTSCDTTKPFSMTDTAFDTPYGYSISTRICCSSKI
jgi:hypothetical protein